MKQRGATIDWIIHLRIFSLAQNILSFSKRFFFLAEHSHSYTCHGRKLSPSFLLHLKGNYCERKSRKNEWEDLLRKIYSWDCKLSPFSGHFLSPLLTFFLFISLSLTLDDREDSEKLDDWLSFRRTTYDRGHNILRMVWEYSENELRTFWEFSVRKLWKGNIHSHQLSLFISNTAVAVSRSLPFPHSEQGRERGRERDRGRERVRGREWEEERDGGRQKEKISRCSSEWFFFLVSFVCPLQINYDPAFLVLELF